jgi:hypothetical protein
MIDCYFNSFTAAYPLPEVTEKDRFLDDYKLMTVTLLAIRSNTRRSNGRFSHNQPFLHTVQRLYIID